MARILILTPQIPYPPQALTGYAQGTTIRNFNLIAGLARRHVVDLLSFHSGEGGGPELLHPYCHQVITVPPPTRSLKRRALDTLVSSLPDMALRLESPSAHVLLAELLRSPAGNYDVLQIEGIEMAPYALALGRAQGPPLRAGTRALPLPVATRPRIIFDDHNAEYVLQKRAFLTDIRRPGRWLGAAYSLIQWQKLARYERRICRFADRVVAVSETDREAIQQLAPGLPVTVAPNGVNLDFYQPWIVGPAPGVDTNCLVFTGKMDYRPNVDAVLWFADEVLPLITAQIPDIRFFVVGQSPHERLARLVDLPGVTITGRVPDTRPYIAGAGIYVVPLRIGGGTRLKVLEAMAMGQAIVSTRLGCDGFAFEDGLQVRFADEPSTFAEAVLTLLRDRDQAAALGRRARAYVEANFGWDTIVPRFEELYK